MQRPAALPTYLLLKFLDSSEQGGVILRSCSLPGSKREAIKARQKEVICELGPLTHQPLSLTVVVGLCDKYHLTADLSNNLMG